MTYAWTSEIYSGKGKNANSIYGKFTVNFFLGHRSLLYCFSFFPKFARKGHLFSLGVFKKTVPDIASPDERPEKTDKNGINDIVFCVLQFPAEFHKCDEVTDKPNGEKPFSKSPMLKKSHLFLSLNWLSTLNRCKPLKTCSSCPDRRCSGGICTRWIFFRLQG